MGQQTGEAGDNGSNPQRPAIEPEVEIESLDKVRCPECDTEDGIKQITHPQCPPAHSGRCTNCGHQGDPLAFHACWERERMTDEEREQARAAYERQASRMAEHQFSAAYISAQREP